MLCSWLWCIRFWHLPHTSHVERDMYNLSDNQDLKRWKNFDMVAFRTTYVIKLFDADGAKDVLNLQPNRISLLPIDTGRKIYYGVETVIFVDYAIFAR